MGATAVHTLFSGQVKGCKVQQAVFVGGTCGSIHVESFNRKIKAWGVLESRLDPIRREARGGKGSMARVGHMPMGHVGHVCVKKERAEHADQG